MPRVCEHEAECKFALREASYPTGACDVGQGSIRMTNMQHALGVIELLLLFIAIESGRAWVRRVVPRACESTLAAAYVYIIKSLLVILNI